MKEQADSQSSSLSPQLDCMAANFAFNTETDSQKIVPFPPTEIVQDDLESELKKIELEEKKIELEEKKIELTQKHLKLAKERREAEIELKSKEKKLEIELQQATYKLDLLKTTQEISIQERAEAQKHQRQTGIHSHWFKMFASTVLLGSGIWLTAQSNDLGPFLLGTGATGAGLQAIPELMQGRKEEKNGTRSPESNKEEDKGE